LVHVIFLVILWIKNINQRSFVLPQNFGISVQKYSSIFSEWFALAGMVLIGSEINFKKIFEDKDSLVVIITYLIVQSADICTTYGWSVFTYLFKK